MDLELLDVRFVDPGFPEKQLGPSYRVWFGNKSSVAIREPFLVTLLAGDGREPASDSPNASTAVDGIDSGQVLSVDIRLPFEALQLDRDDDGQLKPFSTLFIAVDSKDQLAESDEKNNLGVASRTDLKEVDPVILNVEPKSPWAGSTMSLVGEGFGLQAGQVLLEIGRLKMQPEISSWHPLGVQVKLPSLILSQAVDVKLSFVRADGKTAGPVQFKMAPALAQR